MRSSQKIPCATTMWRVSAHLTRVRVATRRSARRRRIQLTQGYLGEVVAFAALSLSPLKCSHYINLLTHFHVHKKQSTHRRERVNIWIKCPGLEELAEQCTAEPYRRGSCTNPPCNEPGVEQLYNFKCFLHGRLGGSNRLHEFQAFLLWKCTYNLDYIHHQISPWFSSQIYRRATCGISELCTSFKIVIAVIPFILDVRLVDAPAGATQDFSTFVLRCSP